VLVIGGGPAGSTTATLLAREGFRTTLLERDRFPRYHIGESLVPSLLPILGLSGALEHVAAAGFRRKGGAYFEWGDEEWALNFGEITGGPTSSWQVTRAEFDHLLLEHAARSGVEVREGVEVTELAFDGERPTAARWSETGGGGATGTLDFDFLVDASGRAGIVATRYLHSRRFNEAFQNVALWGYWRDTAPIDRGPDGAIAVCSVPHGWFWAIPLHDGTVSVGLVTGKEHLKADRARLGALDAVYLDAISQSPLVARVVAPGTLVSAVKAEQDYSYSTETFGGPGYLLAGDAACFLDPLLSTGVHLATFSALLAAATTASVLRGDVAPDEAIAFYTRGYRNAYERAMVLVSTFYQAYRGKDSHFYAAQQLSPRDRQGLRLNEAFLNIVTGVEDLRDAREGAFDAVVEHLTRAGAGSHALLRNYNQAHDPVPLSPANALGGLYVMTKPRLGLAPAVTASAEAGRP
jgi:flavin-dependent dehydrogenase